MMSGPRPQSHLQRYGFFYILVAAFLASWAAQFGTQLMDFQSEQLEHGQQFEWAQFWPDFFRATFENWQSEFLQLAVQALGMVMLKDKIFAVANDDDDDD